MKLIYAARQPLRARKVIDMRTSLGPAIASLIAMGLLGAPAQSFPERNIEVIIPYAPGGGFDVYARAVAQAMERHMPAGLRAIPRNMPGAGSRTGTATMYKAEPDGHTISLVSLPAAAEPHVLGEKVPYDLDRATWLGAIDTGIYALVVGRNAPYQTWEALRAAGKPIFVATTGGTDLTNGKIVAEALKLDFKFLTAYKGAPEAMLAVTRAEADAGMGILNVIAGMAKAGDLKPLVVFQRAGPNLAYPSALNADTIGRPELGALGLYRAFAAPPGLPDAVRKSLIDLMQKALRDPTLAEWSTRTGNPIAPETAGEAAARYAEQKRFLQTYKHLLVQAEPAAK